jgi:MioC protein
MTYQDTFCGGGKQLDRAFEACGARKIGDRLEIDASVQPLPDKEALGWIESWKTLV